MKAIERVEKKEDKERLTLKCQTKNQVRLEATAKSR